MRRLIRAAAAFLLLLVGPAAGQSDDLGGLSDEFDDAGRLAQWKRHDAVEGWPSQIETLDVDSTSRGHLFIQPLTSVWYAGFRAPFLYKDVTGDFVLTTRVRTAGRTREFPDVEGSLAGMMIRVPRAGTAETWKPEDETYLSLTAGLASGPGGRGPALETTVTIAGRSALEWRTGRAEWVDLRIARIGASFVLLYRFEGGAWTATHLESRGVLGRFGGMRPGLIEEPALGGRSVQAGITAMTDWTTIRGKYDGLSAGAPFKAFNSTAVRPPEGSPDLRAVFDYVRFRRLTLPDTLRGRRVGDLTAPELLSLLGD